MTWAIHSIVYRDLGDEAEAARYFVKGYDSYVRGAFKTWHEGYGVFGGVCVSTAPSTLPRSATDRKCPFGVAGLRSSLAPAAGSSRSLLDTVACA